MVSVSTSDGKVFDVEEKVIFQSNLIKNMLSDLETEETIPLQTVDGDIMKKILEYMEKHKDDVVEEPKEPPKGERDSTIYDEWDKNFVDIPENELEKLILAANYLDVKTLLTLCFKAVANLIKDKSVEEIREYFDIEKPKDSDDEKSDKESEKDSEDNEDNEDDKMDVDEAPKQE